MNHCVLKLVLFTLTIFNVFSVLADNKDAVVASRGTAKLTLQDIDTFVMSIPENKRAGFMNSPVRIENMINGQLLQRQLANAARELKLDRNSNLDREKVLADTYLAKIRMDRFEQDLKIPDLEQLAKEKYLANPENFVIRGKKDVQQIIITEASRSAEEADKLANNILKQANEHPEQFITLVERYSESPYKDENHGVIQDVAHQQKQEGLAFIEAAMALKNVGEISPIVVIGRERQILRLIKSESDQPLSYEQVHSELVATLKASFISEARRNYIDKLRNLPLQADPDLVASLRTRYLSNSSGVEPEKTIEATSPTSPSEY